MADREQFRLNVEVRFEADNPAVDAILMVIEDGFGRAAVNRSSADEHGVARATIRFESPSVDARRVNWLHRQLATLSKYLLGPADVECADAEGREASYRLDPAARAASASADEADTESPGEDDGEASVETEQDDAHHG